jgi:hypothetical protein
MMYRWLIFAGVAVFLFWAMGKAWGNEGAISSTIAAKSKVVTDDSEIIY